MIPAGFGDYTPVTAAGRVFFIPFALLAVPIVTSFAVQTITGLVSRLTSLGLPASQADPPYCSLARSRTEATPSKNCASCESIIRISADHTPTCWTITAEPTMSLAQTTRIVLLVRLLTRNPARTRSTKLIRPSQLHM